MRGMELDANSPRSILVNGRISPAVTGLRHHTDSSRTYPGRIRDRIIPRRTVDIPEYATASSAFGAAIEWIRGEGSRATNSCAG